MEMLHLGAEEWWAPLCLQLPTALSLTSLGTSDVSPVCSRLIRTKAGAPRTVAKRMTSNDVFMGSSSLPYGPELQWARGGSGQKRKRPGIRERWHPRRPLGAPEVPPCRRSPLLLSLHNLGF